MGLAPQLDFISAICAFASSNNSSCWGSAPIHPTASQFCMPPRVGQKSSQWGLRPGRPYRNSKPLSSASGHSLLGLKLKSSQRMGSPGLPTAFETSWSNNRRCLPIQRRRWHSLPYPSPILAKMTSFLNAPLVPRPQVMIGVLLKFDHIRMGSESPPVGYQAVRPHRFAPPAFAMFR